MTIKKAEPTPQNARSLALATAAVVRQRAGSTVNNPPGWLPVLAILILMGVALSFASPFFLTVDNLLNVARQVSLIVIVGMGMTFVLTSGGLDISVGSVLAFTGTLAAGLASSGWPLTAAFFAATLVGGVIGMLHAVVIVYGGVSPVIVTLGTFFAVRGAAFLYTKAESGGTAIFQGLPLSFSDFGAGYAFGVPVPVIIAVAAVVIFYALFNKTLLGKHTRAIGGNREAAWLSGIKVNRILFAIYTITGLLAGLSGVILASRLGSGQPNAGLGFEFDVIIATLIGGTSLFGGKGTVVGTVIGALIIGTLANGLNLLDIDPFWQQVVKGLVLIGAVLFDSKVRVRSAS